MERYLSQVDNRTKFWTGELRELVPNIVDIIFVLNPQASNRIHQQNVSLDSVMYDNRGKSEIFLEILLKDSEEHIVAQNYFYPVPIKDIVGIRNPQLTVSIAVPYILM